MVESLCMKQIVKNQHFVPEFYLKQFSIDKQNQGFVVRVFDLRTKRILKKTYSIAEVCRDKFFYAAETGVQDEISQAFEEVFGQIETEISTALPGIIERAIALQLTNNDLHNLAFFMSAQWMRTLSFREWLQKAHSDMMKWMIQAQASHPEIYDFIRRTAEAGEETISDEQKEEVKRFIQSGEYDFRFDNSPHLNFIGEEKVNGFCNLLLV